MFAAQYCVTPTKRPIHRMHEKATTFLRDVKRRSLRVKRSKSLVINPPEKRKSGKKKYKILLDKYLPHNPHSIFFNYQKMVRLMVTASIESLKYG